MGTSSATGSAANAISTRKAPLRPDRERRLQELPGWLWNPHVDRWKKDFRRLMDYVERHGDARTPSPTPSMATPSVVGSVTNAASAAMAPLTPTANTDSRTCPVGHGRHRRRPISATLVHLPSSSARLLRASCTYLARGSEIRRKPCLSCDDVSGPGWDRTSDLPRVKWKQLREKSVRAGQPVHTWSDWTHWKWWSDPLALFGRIALSRFTIRMRSVSVASIEYATVRRTSEPTVPSSPSPNLLSQGAAIPPPG